MSYILDALKKSDRNRQLNTTHTIQFRGDDIGEKRPWKWPLLISLLIAVLVIIFFVYKQTGIEQNQQVVAGGLGTEKIEVEDDIEIDIDDSPVISLNEVAQVVNPKKNTEPSLQNQVENGPKNNVEAMKDSKVTTSQTSLIQKERRGLQSLLGEKKVERVILAESAETESEPSSEFISQNSIRPEADKDTEKETEQVQYTNYRSLRSSLSGLGDMHLDILAYHENPNDRRAYINMKKYLEGDVTAEGSTIREIRPDGVVMSYQGREFILTAK